MLLTEKKFGENLIEVSKKESPILQDPVKTLAYSIGLEYFFFLLVEDFRILKDQKIYENLSLWLTQEF